MKFLVWGYDTMVLKERFIVDENGKRLIFPFDAIVQY